MKKPKLSSLVVMTLVFAAFTLGFLLGRTGQRESVTVSVPAAMQTEPAPVTEGPPPTAGEITFPIDINRAGPEELMALPGIGEVLARRIIAYRDAYGSFSTAEELMKVEDIGEKRLEAILELITVGG